MWECLYCTFCNENDNKRRCEVCKERRPWFPTHVDSTEAHPGNESSSSNEISVKKHQQHQQHQQFVSLTSRNVEATNIGEIIRSHDKTKATSAIKPNNQHSNDDRIQQKYTECKKKRKLEEQTTTVTSLQNLSSSMNTSKISRINFGSKDEKPCETIAIDNSIVSKKPIATSSECIQDIVQDRKKIEQCDSTKTQTKTMDSYCSSSTIKTGISLPQEECNVFEIWYCDVCTLENPLARRRCSVCGSRRCSQKSPSQSSSSTISNALHDVSSQSVPSTVLENKQKSTERNPVASWLAKRTARGRPRKRKRSPSVLSDNSNLQHKEYVVHISLMGNHDEKTFGNDDNDDEPTVQSMTASPSLVATLPPQILPVGAVAMNSTQESTLDLVQISHPIIEDISQANNSQKATTQFEMCCRRDNTGNDTIVKQPNKQGNRTTVINIDSETTNMSGDRNNISIRSQFSSKDFSKTLDEDMLKNTSINNQDILDAAIDQSTSITEENEFTSYQVADDCVAIDSATNHLPTVLFEGPAGPNIVHSPTSNEVIAYSCDNMKIDAVFRPIPLSNNSIDIRKRVNSIRKGSVPHRNESCLPHGNQCNTSLLPAVRNNAFFYSQATQSQEEMDDQKKCAFRGGKLTQNCDDSTALKKSSEKAVLIHPKYDRYASISTDSISDAAPFDHNTHSLPSKKNDSDGTINIDCKQCHENKCYNDSDISTDRQENYCRLDLRFASFHTAGMMKEVTVSEQDIRRGNDILSIATGQTRDDLKNRTRHGSTLKTAPTSSLTSSIQTNENIMLPAATFRTAGRESVVVISEAGIAFANQLLSQQVETNSASKLAVDIAVIDKRLDRNTCWQKRESTDPSISLSQAIGHQYDADTMKSNHPKDGEFRSNPLEVIASSHDAGTRASIELHGSVSFHTAGSGKAITVTDAEIAEATRLLSHNETSKENIRQESTSGASRDYLSANLKFASRTPNVCGPEKIAVVTSLRTNNLLGDKTFPKDDVSDNINKYGAKTDSFTSMWATPDVRRTKSRRVSFSAEHFRRKHTTDPASTEQASHTLRLEDEHYGNFDVANAIDESESFKKLESTGTMDMGTDFQQAGSGKSVEVPLSGMKIATKLFADEGLLNESFNNCVSITNFPAPAFHSAGSGKTIDISKTATDFAASLFDDEFLNSTFNKDEIIHEQTAPTRLSSTGFQLSGSKTEVSISATAVEFASKLSDKERQTKDSENLKYNYEQEVTINEPALGFNSAGSGKSVVISDAAAEFAAKLLCNESVAVKSNRTQSNSTFDDGFLSSTLSNGEIIHEQTAPTHLSSTGFQLAGSKTKVSISATAVEFASKLASKQFQSENVENTCSRHNHFGTIDSATYVPQTGKGRQSLTSDFELMDETNLFSSPFDDFNEIELAGELLARTSAWNVSLDAPEIIDKLNSTNDLVANRATDDKSSEVCNSINTISCTIESGNKVEAFAVGMHISEYRTTMDNQQTVECEKKKLNTADRGKRTVFQLDRPDHRLDVYGEIEDDNLKTLQLDFDILGSNTLQSTDQRSVSDENNVLTSAVPSRSPQVEAHCCAGLDDCQRQTPSEFGSTPHGEVQYAAAVTPCISSLISTHSEYLQYGGSALVASIDSENAIRLIFDSTSGHPIRFGSSIEIQTQLENIRGHLDTSNCITANLTDKWIGNHCRWIIWKLASLERRLTHSVGNSFLSLERLLRHLCQRYSKEFQQGSRSSIRKILNLDVAASMVTIFCVARIIVEETTNENQADGHHSRYRLELSDGWYSIRAYPDKRLCSFIETAKIRVGMKLCISNAVMVDNPNGVDPLDKDYDVGNISSPYLTIHTNSTRIARRDSRLGFVRPNCNVVCTQEIFCIHSLSDVVDDGGPLPFVMLKVVSVGSLLYLERNNEDKGRILTVDEENEKVVQLQRQRQQVFDKNLDDVQKECLLDVDERAPDVWKQMTTSNEPIEYYEALSFQQRQEVDRWNNRRTVLLQDRVQQEMTAKLEEDDKMNRTSIPLLRVVVQDPNGSIVQEQHDDASMNSNAIITVWNPSQDQIEILRAGTTISVRNLNVRPGRYDGMLQLSGNDRTFIRIESDNNKLSNTRQPPPDESESKNEYDIMSSIFTIQVQAKKLAMTNIDDDNVLLPPPAMLVSFVGIVLTCTVSHDYSDDNLTDIHQLFVTDESGLVLQINCCPTSNIHSLISKVLPSSDNQCYVVVRFNNLQLLQQLQQNGNYYYTTLTYDLQSSFDFNDQSRRRYLLDGYTSSMLGSQNLYSMKLHIEAQIPIGTHYSKDNILFGQQQNQHIVAFGYAIQIESVLSISSLVLTVDCGDDMYHNWILPLSLIPTIHKMILSISSSSSSAACDTSTIDRLVLTENVTNELLQFNSGIDTIIKALRQTRLLYHLTALNCNDNDDNNDDESTNSMIMFGRNNNCKYRITKIEYPTNNESYWKLLNLFNICHKDRYVK